MKIYPKSLLLSIIFIFSALQAKAPAQAINSIASYTHSATVPRLSDYTDADIVNIGTHNLEGINEKVKERSFIDVDSQKEIQNVVDEYNTMIASVMSIVTNFILNETPKAPVITGTPKANTNIYNTYQFLPSASDANNDSLTYSIQNQPSWAEFNATTGLL